MAAAQSDRLAVARLWSLHHIDVRWIAVGLWSAVFLFHTLLYLAVVPPWQAPDEPTSVELLLTMAERGRIVSEADKDPRIEREIIASMQRSRYWELGAYGNRILGHAPTLKTIYPCCYTQLNRPALYQGLLMPLAYISDEWAIEQRLLLFRSFSVLLGVLTVGLITWISYELVGLHPALPLVIPALVVGLPQFAYSSAIVNADNLVALIGALLTWLVVRFLRGNTTWLQLAGIIVVVLIGFVAKRTALMLIVPVVVALSLQAIVVWRRGNPKTKVRLLMGAASLFLLVGVALAIPPLRQAIKTFLTLIVFQVTFAHLQSFIFERLIWLPPWLPTSIPFLSQSFWGSFGWHQVVLPAKLLNVLLWTTGLVLAIGLLWFLIRVQQIPSWIRRFVVVCVCTVVSGIIITLVNAPQGILPQGRYLFVILAPISVWLGIGLTAWWRLRWIPVGVVSLWLALLLLDVYTLAWVVIPGFYR